MQLEPTILIIYSLEDKKYYKKIKNHCISAIKKKMLNVKDYIHILAGNKTIDTISKSIEDADIIVVLLSSDFFGDFLSEKKREIGIWEQIIKNFKAHNTKLIPFYLRSYNYNLLEEIRDLEILPNRKKPISKYSNEDEILEETADRLIQIATKEKKSNIQQLFQLLPFPFSEPFILHFFSKKEWEEINNQRNIIEKVGSFWKTKNLNNSITINEKFLNKVKIETLAIIKNKNLPSTDLANILHIFLKYYADAEDISIQENIIKVFVSLNVVELQQETKKLLLILNKLEIFSNRDVKDSIQKARIYRKLADDYTALDDDFEKAFVLGESALEIFSIDTIDKAICLEILGTIYLRRGESELLKLQPEPSQEYTIEELLPANLLFEKSKERYLKAIELREELSLESNLDLAKLHWRIANPFINLGLYQNAMDYLEKAKDIFKNYPKKNVFEEKINKGLAGVYNTMSTVHQMEGRYEDALIFCNKSYFCQKKYYKHNSKQIIYVHLRKASIHYCKEDYDTALDIYEEVKTAQIEILGSEHPDTIATINNIAEIYYSNLKNYDKAIIFFEQILKYSNAPKLEKTMLYAKIVDSIIQINQLKTSKLKDNICTLLHLLSHKLTNNGSISKIITLFKEKNTFNEDSAKEIFESASCKTEFKNFMQEHFRLLLPS